MVQQYNEQNELETEIQAPENRPKGRLFSNRDLFLLIGPLLIEQFLSIFTGLADSIMVSRVGEAAVSGVSLIDSIMILLIYIFSALATGGAVIAGQYLGRNDPEKARQGANDLMWFAALFSLAVMALIYALRLFILNVVFGKVEPDVWACANTYLLITGASIPLLAVYNAGAAIFRTMGNARITMVISLISNGVNIVGNAVCIYGLNMGTEGVAIPTLISRLLSALIVSVLLCSDRHPLSLERSLRHHFDWDMVKRILRIGIPGGLENGMFQLGRIMLISLVSGFSTAAITANAITGTLSSFQVISGHAVELTETTVISRCVGAGDYEQAKYYNKKLILITYVSLWCVNLLIMLALNFILGLYHLTPGTEALTRQLIWIHTLSAVLIWPLTFDLPAVFRAAGDVRFAMVTSIVSMWVFRLGTAYVLALGFELGVLGVWLAMVADWAFRAVMFTGRYISGRWQNHRAV